MTSGLHMPTMDGHTHTIYNKEQVLLLLKRLPAIIRKTKTEDTDLEKNTMSQRDGSVGNGTCHQAW